MSYRYLGNKSRLAEWIVNEIEKVIPRSGAIADPMCGTASVSFELAKRGYSVVASDALVFPTLHAKARLLHDKSPEFKPFNGYLGIINEINNLSAEEGYFFKEFSEHGNPEQHDRPRLYFSSENAGRIDAARNFIARCHKDGNLTTLERDLLLHDLILAVNRIANIAGTYGYFRSTISAPAKKTLTLMPSEFYSFKERHSVDLGSAKEVLPRYKVDAVYLDPPYTKRQYAGNYHLLETIAVGDCPPAIGAGGLRPWKNDASDFCYKRKVEGAFRDTIESCNAKYIFISYSEDGQINPTDLKNLLQEYGAVTCYSREYSRYRSNGGVKDGSVLEYLYRLEVK
ncbi:DNA adenine methylase [Corynebacterium sp. HMSC077G01]|uniref:DNA adenine methylase n=1 Tax=Corynebacterium sp. HMSC077G01 TaxID=1715193 RepID=UPI0009F20471|nr:DNA adenine methylase [Corynebacterium sp. HMSC077G01]